MLDLKFDPQPPVQVVSQVPQQSPTPFHNVGLLQQPPSLNRHQNWTFQFLLCMEMNTKVSVSSTCTFWQLRNGTIALKWWPLIKTDSACTASKYEYEHKTESSKGSGCLFVEVIEGVVLFIEVCSWLLTKNIWIIYSHEFRRQSIKTPLKLLKHSQLDSRGLKEKRLSQENREGPPRQNSEF